MLKKVPPLVPIALALGALCLVLGLFGDTGRLALRYERTGLQSGEWWRLFSAHFVHLGWAHTALNIVALLLLAAIFGPFVRALEGVIVIAVAALAIDVGLYVIAAEIDWYVGLSGVLHGLFAAGAVAIGRRDLRFALVLGAGLCGKLAYEILGGPLSATAAIAGGNVVTEAHLYGSVGGVAALVLVRAIGGERHGPV